MDRKGQTAGLARNDLGGWINGRICRRATRHLVLSSAFSPLAETTGAQQHEARDGDRIREVGCLDENSSRRPRLHHVFDE